MKRCLIITGGNLDLSFAGSYLEKNQFDTIVAVDGGLEAVQALRLKPDAVVGDFDTLDLAVFQQYQNMEGISWDIHKPEKNETDTELAVNTAISLGCGDITMLGALGGRMDHSLGNLHLLYYCLQQGVSACLIDEKNRISVLDTGRTFHKSSLWGKYVSFLPLSEEVNGITLTGFQYPLYLKDITIGPSLCISNELAEETASITFTKGVLICVESHD